MQSLSRHFPLFLDEPGELGPVRLTTNRTVAALADIVEESEFQFGSLTGRLCYRRGHGVLFVFAYLGNVCPCLQAALGLEEFQQIAIARYEAGEASAQDPLQAEVERRGILIVTPSPSRPRPRCTRRGP